MRLKMNKILMILLSCFIAQMAQGMEEKEQEQPKEEHKQINITHLVAAGAVQLYKTAEVPHEQLRPAERLHRSGEHQKKTEARLSHMSDELDEVIDTAIKQSKKSDTKTVEMIGGIPEEVYKRAELIEKNGYKHGILWILETPVRFLGLVWKKKIETLKYELGATKQQVIPKIKTDTVYCLKTKIAGGLVGTAGFVGLGYLLWKNIVHQFLNRKCHF